MKKFLCILVSIFCICTVPTYSADMLSSDLWDNWSGVNSYGVKPTVSDEEVERAFKQMDEQVNKSKNKAKKKLIPKGKQRTQANETEQIKATAGKDSAPPVLCVSSEVMIGDEVLPIGHYQVKGEIENGTPVLNLYQASSLMAKIPAVETKNDYDKEELLFTDFIVNEDNTVTIIYGSVDFNAYAVLNLVSAE